MEIYCFLPKKFEQCFPVFGKVWILFLCKAHCSSQKCNLNKGFNDLLLIYLPKVVKRDSSPFLPVSSSSPGYFGKIHRFIINKSAFRRWAFRVILWIAKSRKWILAVNSQSDYKSHQVSPQQYVDCCLHYYYYSGDCFRFLLFL